MIWKKFLSALWPEIKKFLALLVKEFLIYADQRVFVFWGLVFQMALFLAIFYLGVVFKDFLSQQVAGFSLNYLEYSYLVVLLIFIFSSISGFLPGRLLQELGEKNLSSFLLTPTQFWLWVEAAGAFGFLINFFYLLFLIGVGIFLFKLNFGAGLGLIFSLTLILAALLGIALFISGVTLIFKRAFFIYGFLETSLILLIAFLLPSPSFLGGFSFFLKITPHYLAFKILNACLENNFWGCLRFQFFLGLETVIFWLFGLIFLNFGFNFARKKGLF